MSAPRCTGRKTNGEPCKGWRVPGSTVCRKHLPSPKARARAAVRAEVMAWGLDAPTVDPGETLLKLVSQSAARAQRYAGEIEDMVSGKENLRDALIRQAYGEFGPVGEYIRGIVVLEAQERERCASWAAKAIAAGLNERMVRLAERQGDLIADLLRAVLGDPELGLTDEQRRAVPGVSRRHLALLAAG